jgi:transcriptional regulator with XRE-family HTH domain
VPRSARKDLQDFLKARRASLRPTDVGLPAHGRRRTPGLRREDVAALAGVGLSWYTWLEQGREINVSSDMLTRLASALRLSFHDTNYLFSLAGHRPPAPPASPSSLTRELQQALDAFTAPAFLLNARMDTLGFNHLADALYAFDDFPGPLARNNVWRLFMDPRRERVYVDSEAFGEFGVGILRGMYATRAGDPEFESLISALLEHSATFARLWHDSRGRGTSATSPNTVRLRHGASILSFIAVRLTRPTRPDDLLVLLLPSDAACAAWIARMSTGRVVTRPGRARSSRRSRGRKNSAGR